MIQEFAMISVLAGMGVYFVKSTDLPKNLTERNISSSVESTNNAFTKLSISKELEINKLDLEINDLTLKITSLEQEIRVNNQKNAEIQSQIDRLLIKLEKLNNLKLA